MSIEKIQQVLFNIFDIRQALPVSALMEEANPDTGETVLDYITECINILEEMENEYEEDNPR